MGPIQVALSHFWIAVAQQPSVHVQHTVLRQSIAKRKPTIRKPLVGGIQIRDDRPLDQALLVDPSQHARFGMQRAVVSVVEHGAVRQMLTLHPAERVELVGDAKLFAIYCQYVCCQACLGVVLEAFLSRSIRYPGRAVSDAPINAAVFGPGAYANGTAERVARDAGDGLICRHTLDEMISLVPAEPRGATDGTVLSRHAAKVIVDVCGRTSMYVVRSLNANRHRIRDSYIWVFRRSGGCARTLSGLQTGNCLRDLVRKRSRNRRQHRFVLNGTTRIGRPGGSQFSTAALIDRAIRIQQ